MKSLRHDLGSAFTAKLFQSMLKMFDIQSKHGVPWHSQANGLCEAMNKRINTCIRTCLDTQQQRNFDQWLGYITFTLNALKSSKTKHSANFLVFSRELTAPRDLFTLDDERTDNLQHEICDISKQQNIYDTYMSAQKISRNVIQAIQEKAKHMKAAYDKHIKGPYFEKGQHCMLLIKPNQHKWLPRFDGPYLITEKISDHNYMVKIGDTQKLVNIEKMKRYKTNKFSPSEKNTVQQKEDTPKESDYETAPTSAPSGGDDSDSDSDSDDDNFPTTTRNQPIVNTHRPNHREEPARATESRPTTPAQEDIIPTPVESSTPAGPKIRKSTRKKKPTDILSYDTLGGAPSKAKKSHLQHNQ